MSEVPVTPVSNDVQLILMRLAQLEAENQGLSMRLEEAHRISHVPTPAPQDLEPKVSLPERFNGDRNKLRTFLNQLELVFLLNPSRYRYDSAKVATAGTLLTGAAAAWFNPLLEHPNNNTSALNDWSVFKERLRGSFGGIDAAVQAANEIRRLRQGNGTVSAYTAKFLQTAADLNWNEDALMDQYRAGLCEEVKDALVYHERPSSLQNLAALATRCDNRLLERRLEQSHPQGQRQPRPNPHSTLPPAAYVPVFDGDHGDQTSPMEVDAITRRSLSDYERNRRHAERLCLYCAAPDHWKDRCPAIRRRGPSTQNTQHAPKQGNYRRQ